MSPQTTATVTTAVAPSVTHTVRPQPVAAAVDWEEWYEELTSGARRGLRNRVLTASYDEVRDDAELRSYFLFYSDDLAEERAPGTDRVRELVTIVTALKGRADPEGAQQRRKAVAFLLAEFQAYLRDNPWAA